MTISVEQIKTLRERTGVSMALCTKALKDSDGDIDGAIEFLRKEGANVADKKAGRALNAGVIDAYVHSTKKSGVLLEVRTETDFVANNEEFRAFCHNIAMHIAAAGPADVTELLAQPYIKNSEITIGDYVKEIIQKFGENTAIERFVRYSAE